MQQRPADSEEHRLQCPLGVQDALLVVRVCLRLIGEQKARSRHRRGRALIAQAAYVLRAGHAAGREQRCTVGHVEHPRKCEREWLDADQVAARLDALYDEPVGTVVQRPPGLGGCADSGEHRYACLA